MASYYVWSAAAGAGTGADWTNAYTTMTTALSGKAAGDVFYIAHDHAESTAAAITLTSPGTLVNPCKFLCVNRAGSVPPVSADLRDTGVVGTTGANSNITVNGSLAECYGITFSASSGASTGRIALNQTGAHKQKYTACLMKINGTGGTGVVLTLGVSTGAVLTIFENTDVQLSASTQNIQQNSLWFWRNSALTGTAPTTAILDNNTRGHSTFIEGVDLSGVSGTIIGSATNPSQVILKDCKLHASATIYDATGGPAASIVEVIRCSSGAVNYRNERHRNTGSVTTETTIVRTGGASDGTTQVARKIVTSSTASKDIPFESIPMSIWNETTGAPVTVTVEGTWGGGAVPNNDDIWIVVEYLGSSGSPVGSFATSGKADTLATGTANTSSSEVWGGSTSEFKMAVTVTPQMKGPITVYVCAGAASSTFYYDPKPLLS